MTIETASLAGVEKNSFEQAIPLKQQPKASSQQEAYKAQTRWRTIWLDTWLFEIVSLGFSMACFIALCGVLGAYDNEKQPQMAYNITLNAIVSVLATGCKSSLVLVIGEAISQLKWLWFRGLRCRQLFDLQRFDAASRGPLGSLMILIHHRSVSLVSIGAVVVVLLLAFDPFIQQVLSYSVRETESDGIDGAFAPQLRGWFPTSGDLDWWSAFEQAIWTNENFNPQPTCSSGNCIWEEFSSIGICSRCADISTVATLNCTLPSPKASFNRTCQIIRPHGDVVNFTTASDGYLLTLPNMIVSQTFVWTGNTGPNTTFDGVDPPLLTYAYAEIALHDSQISPSSPVSDRMFIKNLTECSLSVCLRDYNLSVTNGQTSIQTLKIDYGTIYNNYTEVTPTSKEISLCWRPRGYNDTDKSTVTKFMFCDFGMMNISPYVQYFFPGVSNAKWVFHETVGDNWEGLNGEDTGPGLSPNFGRIMHVGFEEAMANVAASLTKLGLSNTNYSVNGTVYVSKVFVSIQWPWLILPALSVLTGSIFVIVTIVLNTRSNAPLWKSSALACIYHGLEGGDKDEYMNVSTMEKSAEVENVQLRYSVNKERLMLRFRESIDDCHHPLPECILNDNASDSAKTRIARQRSRSAFTI